MSNYSIKIVRRTDKVLKNGDSPLVLRVTINSKAKRYGLNVKVNPKDWDAKNEKIICNSNPSLTKALNNKINKQKIDLLSFCYKKETSGVEISFSVIDSYFEGINYENFYELFDYILSEKKLSENTKYRYDLLREYLKEFKSNIATSDVNYTFIKSFDTFLNKKNAGAYNYHKCLKSILAEAVKHDFIYKSPYLKFTFKSPESKEVFLEPKEVVKIKKLRFSIAEKKYNIIRDIFLIYCYTGLRYSDVENLRVQNIDFGKNILEIKMIKTNEDLKIPLSIEARSLLCRYSIGKKKSEYVFPKITNQNLNRELKKIAILAKIDKNVTCHVGRHTFASNLSNMRKISLPIISKLLGHKNIANTSIYTNSNLNVMKESLKDFRYEIKH